MMVGDIDNAIKLTEDNDEIDSFIIYVDSLNNVTEYSSFGFMVDDHLSVYPSVWWLFWRKGKMGFCLFCFVLLSYIDIKISM